MTTKRLATIAIVTLLTVLVNGGRPFSLPHDGSALPRHHFEDRIATGMVDIRPDAELSLRAGLTLQTAPRFKNVPSPVIRGDFQQSRSAVSSVRPDYSVITIHSSASSQEPILPAPVSIQAASSYSIQIGSASAGLASDYPTEEIVEPVVPVAVMATLVNEDPWNGALSASDDNPFTQVLLQSDIDPPGPGTSGQDDGGSSGDGSDVPPEPADPSPSDGGDDTPSESADNSGSTTVESSEGNPEFIVYIRTTAGNIVGLRTERIGENHFKLNSKRTLEIQFCGTFLDQRGDPCFLLFDDFNDDHLTDALNIHQSNGTCQLFLNTGAELVPMVPFTPANRPKFGTRLPFREPGRQQLALYSAEGNLLDLYEETGAYRFELMTSLPFANSYDGLASTDFNGDGFGDLILQNLEQNRVNFLQNVNGQALKLMATTPAQFFPPILAQFSPWPGRAAAKLWLCTYNEQLMIYPVISGRSRLAMLLDHLEAENCLVMGDFNQDRRIDIAIGRLSQ